MISAITPGNRRLDAGPLGNAVPPDDRQGRSRGLGGELPVGEGGDIVFPDLDPEALPVDEDRRYLLDIPAQGLAEEIIIAGDAFRGQEAA